MKLFFGNVLLKDQNSTCDYLEDLAKNIENRVVELFKFFNIDTLNKKINIVLWNDVNEFRLFAKSSLKTTIPTWMCGWVQNQENLCIINTLILEELRKCASHSNNQIQDLENIIIHEIVHIIVKYVAGNRKTKKWLIEALATKLANQQQGIRFNQSIDNFYSDDFVDYGTFNLIGQFLLSKTSKNYIIHLIKDSRFLTDEIINIYKGVKLYFNECNNKC